MFRISDEHPHKMILTRLRTITLLIIALFSTILIEMMFNFLLKSYPKRTLLEHVQSSLTLTIVLCIILGGCICFILLIGLIMIASNYSILIIYMMLLKFFELIPPLIDLINLFFIFGHQQNSSTRLILSLFLAITRLIMNLYIVRRRANCRWKQRIIIICDLLLFILFSVSLFRYTSKNPFRIGRKIALGILLFQLNDLLYNEFFWIGLINWKKEINSYINFKFVTLIFRLLKIHIEYPYLNIIHFILFIRWMIASLFICLFSFYTYHVSNDTSFSLRDVYLSFKCYVIILTVCILLLSITVVDTVLNRDELKRLGFLSFCTRLDGLSIMKSNEIVPDAQLQETNAIVEDTR